MNLNKLFPRLTIRAKLTIAFVLLAGVPLVLVAGVATQAKVANLRETAAGSLDHDLQIAHAQVQRALQEAEENVAYLARAFLTAPLHDPTPERLGAAGRSVAAFMHYKQSLYQVKLIDEDGRILLVSGPDGSVLPENGQPSGMYYAYRAQTLEPGGQLLLPVELSSRAADAQGPIPAIAVVMALWDPAGRFRGVVAGEAYAAALFAGLESAVPHLPGVTGLVDREGFFLYHSERKRDWASLLAARADVDLQREFSPELAASIMGGTTGALTTGRQLVTFAPLSFASYGSGPLFLYRAVALSALEGPVREFMRWVLLAALLLGGCVLALAMVAASQFTQPIYRLRAAMRQLAGGDVPVPLAITTNDELEDLATEFGVMATSLTSYRQRLEELVAERTRALHETYGELASVLAHSVDAIIGLDAARRIRVWNGGAESLFGYSAQEAVGNDVDRLLCARTAEAKREAALLQRRLAEDGVVVHFRTSRVHRAGREVPVSLTQSVIRDEHGVAIGYSLLLRDATAQDRLETQMRRSERLAAASVMATALAHEVNNPLAIIGNRIECMERDVHSRCPGCSFEGDLAVLRQHTERLVGVTRDLLGLTTGEADVTGRVDLSAVAERTSRLVEQTFRARDVHLDLRAAPALPQLHGNEKALETVCLNLLLNAVAATPVGGSVTLETRLARDGAELELEVADTGSGIPAGLREQIFEPFFTTKGARGGTGLGLAVCRTVVERHGGRIRVDSEEGRGSRFVVSVPVPALVPA
jgi:PAS domain S-box-containing protein